MEGEIEVRQSTKEGGEGKKEKGQTHDLEIFAVYFLPSRDRFIFP